MLSYVIPKLDRAGFEATGPAKSSLLSFRETASPAPLEGVPVATAGLPGTPSCLFCPAGASVIYDMPGLGEVELCGGHALRILGDLPAVALSSMEGAA